MSHYDDVLQELRRKGQILANKYIVELYNILRDEEKLSPQVCRSKIEHDCIDLWSKATIRKYLSPEAKDTKKQKAGKLGVEKKKELQLLATQDGARINPAENDSNSQNEAESRTFHNEQELSTRVSAPEMHDIKLNENKDRRIQELEELVKQGGWVCNKTIFLPSKFALQIYQTTSVNRSAGTPSEFKVKFAEACGGKGYAIKEPSEVKSKMHQGMKERKPTIIEAYLDPFEPPMPPKVEMSFVTNLAKSFAKGQPYTRRIGLTLFRDQVHNSLKNIHSHSKNETD